MAILFGNVGRKTKNTGPASQLRIQTAIQGTPIPVGWGQFRIAANIIWYGAFKATPVKQTAAGGKGGVLSGGKAGNTGTYNYSAAVILGLCEGMVGFIGQVWSNKVITSIGGLGLGLFLGDYLQAAWSFVTSLYPGQARTYRGIAYLAGEMQLGTSPEVPNMSYEVAVGFLYGTGGPGLPDVSPALCLTDYLTNAHYGVGFDPAWVADMTVYYQYGLAAGLAVSPVMVTQQAANVFVKDLLQATNSEAVWSAGQLKVVPYGDMPLAANGGVYTPPAAPLYDLTDDDFILGNNSYSAPVVASYARVQDRANAISIEYLDRANQYNPTIYEVKNDAAIEQWGLKKRDTRQLHFFCNGPSAVKSAVLQLGRESVRVTYKFTIGSKFILLEPMDIVSITDAGLGLDRQTVRIKEIQENADYTLTIAAEEVLVGTGEAPVYAQDANQGNVPDYNTPPGNPNTPLFFEPTDPLAGGLYVDMVVTGGADWGGADVYVSSDGVNYALQGRLIGSGRKGILTAALPTAAVASSGQTIDTGNTLSVLLEETGQLLPGTQADVIALNTLCWVNGELIAYRDVTLTAPEAYDLTYLVRGSYGTTPKPHAAGAPFARVDAGVFEIPFTQDRIGQDLYIKLVSFNIYAGGQQSLAEVSPSVYTIQGTALTAPLPNIRNFRTSYQGTLTFFSWDEVADFRPVVYEIRQGTSWASAQVIGRYAHPPVAAPQGDGTYWISAYSQPVANLSVYSSQPADIAITGSILTANIVATHDEAGAGWPGTH